MSKRALLLLTIITLLLAIANGTAMAAIENGPIYYAHGYREGSIPYDLHSIDPTVSNPQPIRELAGESINTFDISQDSETLVYEEVACEGFCTFEPLGPLYIIKRFSLSQPFFLSAKRQVNIANLWDCKSIPTTPDFDCSRHQQMLLPEFSPDGETIYFAGRYILGPDDELIGVYSVPTKGGAATKIPIINSDGTPRPTGGQFAVSHDGTKLAIGGYAGIFTVPVSGGVPSRVSQDPCGSAVTPSFSQDDQRILYARYVRKDDSCTGTGTVIRTLFSTPADNGGTRPGTPLFPEDIADPDTHGSKSHPTFSPDGESVAFAHLRNDAPTSLGIAPATGGSITNLTRCDSCDPVWLVKPPDTTLPTVSSVSPAHQAQDVAVSTTVEATFSEAMDEASVEAQDTFTLKEEGFTTTVAATVSYNPSTKKATLTPGANLAPDTTYTATILGGANGARDLAGNALAQDRTWTFTTVSAPPTVVSYTPTLTTGVPRSTKPTATFSTNMDESTLTASNIKFQVYNKRQQKWIGVAHTVSYDGPSKTATVIPGATLGSSKKYRLTVTTNVMSSIKVRLDQDPSISGNQPKVWTFTTGSV
jgi:Tol biopolymer transport system component